MTAPTAFSSQFDTTVTSENPKRPVRILIVDDDPIIVSLLKQILSQKYEVQTAEHGQSAWDILQNQEFKSDLVFSDIQMPEMNGLELLKNIMAEYPQIGVIMMSGSSDIETAVESLRKGAYDYICKPFKSLNELDYIIDRWLYTQSLEAKLADYARLQSEMMKNMRLLTFVSVDVVASRKLKNKADLFLVQYSFTKFQDFIQKITEQHHGMVHNTSGDGAMCSFNVPGDALNAASKMVSGLKNFNSRVNRLQQDFSIRIGAHTGPVIVEEGGTISDMFSETLDITGHIQKRASANKVHISKALRDNLNINLDFAPTKVLVEDIPVYVVDSQD